MATTGTDALNLDRFRPRRSTVYVAVALVVLEAIVVAWYVTLTDRIIGGRGVDYLVFPMVWITVGVLAVWRTTPPPAPKRRTLVAGTVAAGYAVVLAYFGGVLAPGAALGGPPADGFGAILAAPPGLSPTISYSGLALQVVVIPYKVVGYAALVYLVYATVLDAAGSAIAGILGLFSCISCSWPIVASLFTGVVGAGSATTAAAFMPDMKLSTLVFVVTVALLYWRPVSR